MIGKFPPSSLEMNRTIEFQSYINKESRVSAPKPRPPKPKSPLYDLTRDIQIALASASSLIYELERCFGAEEAIGENEQKISELMDHLNEDIKGLADKISTLEKIGAEDKHNKSVIILFRQNLTSIVQRFKVITEKRGNIDLKRLERRKAIGTSSQEIGSFQTAYNDEDEVEVQTEQNLNPQMLTQRYEQITQVESSINQIMSMFARLGEIIASADYEIERIDTNTEKSKTNMEAARVQLEKYYEKVKGKKWLMIKVFLILLVFSIIFILIV